MIDAVTLGVCKMNVKNLLYVAAMERLEGNYDDAKDLYSEYKKELKQWMEWCK